MSPIEGSPGLPYPKLPLWDVANLAYTSYFRHFAALLRASWLWLLMITPVTAVAMWQQWSWLVATVAHMIPGHPPLDLRPTGVWALMYLGNALTIFAGVSIAVAWHRMMILNERPGFSGSNIVTRNLWRYVLVGFLLCLIIILPSMTLMFPVFSFLMPRPAIAANFPAPFLASMFAIFALNGVAIAIVLRLCLLLPARAVGDTRLTLKEVWQRTRGNTWRLFWGLVMTTFPPLLLAEIAFVAVARFPRPGVATDEDVVIQMTVASTIMMLYYLVVLPISVGFLSHAYRHFFQEPSEFA